MFTIINAVVLCMVLAGGYPLQINPCFTEIRTREEDKFSDEDVQMLRDSINTYGPPQSLTSENLPGPEIVIGQNVSAADGYRLIKDNSGNYILKLRRITAEFSYTSRYEVGTLEIVNAQLTLVVKGQFSEQFPRRSGGYYIRTFGYVSNNTGYTRFWGDLSKVVPLEMKSSFINLSLPFSQACFLQKRFNWRRSRLTNPPGPFKEKASLL